MEKFVYISIAIFFIIVTLGLIDVEIEFSDGNKFEYNSWF